MLSLVLVVLATSCFVIAGGQALNCYSCVASTASSGSLPDLSSYLPGGLEVCTASDYGAGTDCTRDGGCVKTEFVMTFSVAGVGEVALDYIQRGCGAPVDGCVSGREVQEALESQETALQSALAGTGVTYVSGTGSVCYCTGELCNHAPNVKASASLLFVTVLIAVTLKLYPW